MLTVAFNETNKSIEFFVDQAGIDLLVRRLGELKGSNGARSHLCNRRQSGPFTQAVLRKSDCLWGNHLGALLI